PAPTATRSRPTTTPASTTSPEDASTPGRCRSAATPTPMQPRPTATVLPRPDPAIHPPTRSTSRGNTLKIKVDYDMCASTGGCMQICPEVFEVRSDGYLYVLQDEPPPELHDKVR